MDLYGNNIRVSDKVAKKVVKYVALKVLKLDASLCIFSEDAKCLVKGSFDALSLERCIRYAIDRAASVRALAESERRARSLMETAGDGILILRGDGSRGEFYSIAVSNGAQQVDSGTKMIHLGKNTSSRIIAKGIAAGFSENVYRGQVSAHRKATNTRNFTQCDSLLIGDKCGAHTFPYIDVRNSSSSVEHEASTSKISEDQLFYCQSRGIGMEDAISMVINGFCKDVFTQLPMEFAVEATKLLGLKLEGSVG